MIDMTPDAKQRFDAYLQRTRTALRGTRAVEPAEVEQNVIVHSFPTRRSSDLKSVV